MEEIKILENEHVEKQLWDQMVNENYQVNIKDDTTNVRDILSPLKL